MRCYRRIRSRVLQRTLVSIAKSESRVLGTIARSHVAVRQRSGSARATIVDRVILEYGNLGDPLNGSLSFPPVIDVVIPVGQNDVSLLPLVLAGIREAVRNPIRQITVLGRCSPTMTRILAEDGGVLFVDEESILSPAINEFLDSLQEQFHTKNWFYQQALKWKAVLMSSANAVLVVDADTILLRERIFFDGEQQLLMSVHEFNQPYEDHFISILGSKSEPALACSFVAHHQLMIPQRVREMFQEIDQQEDTALLSWFRAGADTGQSSVSEYHTYGRWLIDRYPEQVCLARWGNLPLPRSKLGFSEGRSVPADTLRQLQDRFGGAYSLSAHGYLDLI